MNTTFDFAQESKKLENLQNGQNWAFCDIGSFDEVKDYVMENKEINLKCPSKLFLHKVLGLSGAEISFNALPAGMKSPLSHKHKENEEIIIVLSGEGTFDVDNEIIQVKEGSVLRIAPEGVRAVSAAKGAGLTYICIQVKSNSLQNYTLTDAEML